jgi:hypothetical protein
MIAAKIGTLVLRHLNTYTSEKPKPLASVARCARECELKGEWIAP